MYACRQGCVQLGLPAGSAVLLGGCSGVQQLCFAGPVVQAGHRTPQSCAEFCFMAGKGDSSGQLLNNFSIPRLCCTGSPYCFEKPHPGLPVISALYSMCSPPMSTTCSFLTELSALGFRTNRPKAARSRPWHRPEPVGASHVGD